MEMRTNTAERLDWPVVATGPRLAPEPEPQDLTACLAGPNGLDLVVDLAHDLRSPLTSILFLAEALQQGQGGTVRSEEHTSELQSRLHLVCRLLLEKKKKTNNQHAVERYLLFSNTN